MSGGGGSEEIESAAQSIATAEVATRITLSNNCIASGENVTLGSESFQASVACLLSALFSKFPGFSLVLGSWRSQDLVSRAPYDLYWAR